MKPKRRQLRTLVDAGSKLAGSPLSPTVGLDLVHEMTEDAEWRALVEDFTRQDEFVALVREACLSEFQEAAAHRDQIVSLLHDIWRRLSTTNGSAGTPTDPAGHDICSARRILWVDDQMETLSYYAQQLSDVGWTIDFAPNLRSAVATLVAEPYRVLLIDQMIPVFKGRDFPTALGGVALLRWLRGAPLPKNITQELIPFLRASPHPQNRRALAAFITSYRDTTISNMAMTSSTQDADIEFIFKPLHLGLLTHLLRKFEPASAQTETPSDA